MNSQQSRLERYRILYVWKILNNVAPNCGLEEVTSDRRGRECRVPLSKDKIGVRSLRAQSFQVHGPQHFNSLPKEIRNLKKISVEEFKKRLDQFLMKIPDLLKIGDLIPSTCEQFSAKPSNSIIDQAREESRPRGGALLGG
jgi:hypothetical protein